MSIQARYTPGTAANHAQREACKAYRYGLQPHCPRVEPETAQPLVVGVVHPRWPVPLKGLLAAELFFGLRRKV